MRAFWNRNRRSILWGLLCALVLTFAIPALADYLPHAALRDPETAQLRVCRFDGTRLLELEDFDRDAAARLLTGLRIHRVPGLSPSGQQPVFTLSTEDGLTVEIYGDGTAPIAYRESANPLLRLFGSGGAPAAAAYAYYAMDNAHDLYAQALAVFGAA